MKLTINFSEYGRITEKSLMIIRNLPLSEDLDENEREEIVTEVLDTIAGVWSRGKYRKKNGLYVFMADNSNDEKLIMAFLESDLAWVFDWQTLGGDFYVIAVTKEAKKLLRDAVRRFRNEILELVEEPLEYINKDAY